MERNPLNLLKVVTNSIYDEATFTFPKFALRDNWSALLWPAEENSEAISWIDRKKFEALRKTIQSLHSSNRIYMVWEALMSGSGSKKGFRPVVELELSWQSLVDSQVEVSQQLLPSEGIYIFDAELDWFIHIDESILLAGTREFVNRFTSNYGGFETTYQATFARLEHPENTDDFSLWFSRIKSRFILNRKDEIN
ncbi:hypothetical protein [Paraferrimonas sedimenticola]|uniref:Uncharacterized protein n=1 Tax=Paraferrimonas sedimenticola TaxID=375674 RepID=A0AA37RQX1_9GAMM|nr:hypothetical protein [Paraferrimonas sedimenticola]GLP94695.1 hypothetical protein GCM10007895_00010 [Paraferrimonas sedimenticola]